MAEQKQQNKIKRKVNKRKNIIQPTLEQKQTKKIWVKMIYKLHAIKTVNFCAVGVDCTQDCFLNLYCNIYVLILFHFLNSNLTEKSE